MEGARRKTNGTTPILHWPNHPEPQSCPVSLGEIKLWLLILRAPLSGPALAGSGESRRKIIQYRLPENWDGLLWWEQQGRTALGYRNTW